MPTTRRTLIKSAALGTGAVALTSCERSISVLTQAFGQSVPEHLAVAQSTEIDPEFHLLSRAAFGPWPGDLERLMDPTAVPSAIELGRTQAADDAAELRKFLA